MNARLMPATITNMVADRPVTVITASVGLPSSSSASKVFAASIENSANPRDIDAQEPRLRSRARRARHPAGRRRPLTHHPPPTVRVVFNDGLRLRQQAREAGEKYLSDGELSKPVITQAKDTPERAWPGGVSSVVLQQAPADLNTAYRNFFASITGNRKGRKLAPPWFRSRKDNRQAIRFTKNSRFTVLDNGRLRLPKIGDPAVRWSRACWRTRPPGTGAPSAGWTGSSPPSGCAPTAAGSTTRWPPTCERGIARAAAPTTGTSTPPSTCWPPGRRTTQTTVERGSDQ
jgi:hypothetical protein